MPQIELIPSVHALTVLEKLPTTGSEPMLVLGDDAHAYYVKNDGQTRPAWSMVNETLCHYLLRLWGIPTPDIALVQVAGNLLDDKHWKRHPKAAYKTPAFGSKQIPHAYDMNRLLASSNGISNSVDFARIGLFDMWVENEDRPPNMKNLLLAPSGKKLKLYAIDHAMAFRSGAYSSLVDADFDFVVDQYYLEVPLLRDFAFSGPKWQLDAWMEGEEKKFYLCVAKCKAVFPDIVQSLPPSWGFMPEVADLMFDCLFSERRNKKVFHAFASCYRS